MELTKRTAFTFECFSLCVQMTIPTCVKVKHANARHSHFSSITLSLFYIAITACVGQNTVEIVTQIVTLPRNRGDALIWQGSLHPGQRCVFTLAIWHPSCSFAGVMRPEAGRCRIVSMPNYVMNWRLSNCPRTGMCAEEAALLPL